jgi:hypothetical protein
MLEDLEKYLLASRREADGERRVELFAPRAYYIERSAGPASICHVRGRIDRMLNSRPQAAAATVNGLRA